ncbi:MAG: prepilin-type N-terminal cleavage/methylation domain-containing protein [Verrucomicrobiota bacterium JB023]|nr:prepilin-type N-terminal cleavage/methylation domain-containing protein [Verrucomicrobiota bacterium JB023]
MKSPSPRISRKQGMTLLEMTVVILVLLSLVSILVMGARSWKKGADRASSIVVIRAAQLGMRAYATSQLVEEGELPGMPDSIFGPNLFVANDSGNPGDLPAHPASGDGVVFAFVDGEGETVPPLGSLYICTGGADGVSNFDYNPRPEDYRGW